LAANKKDLAKNEKIWRKMKRLGNRERKLAANQSLWEPKEPILQKAKKN
jgi:hypothetical protein